MVNELVFVIAEASAPSNALNGLSVRMEHAGPQKGERQRALWEKSSVSPPLKFIHSQLQSRENIHEEKK